MNGMEGTDLQKDIGRIHVRVPRRGFATLTSNGDYPKGYRQVLMQISRMPRGTDPKAQKIGHQKIEMTDAIPRTPNVKPRRHQLGGIGTPPAVDVERLCHHLIVIVQCHRRKRIVLGDPIMLGGIGYEWPQFQTVDSTG
ncbi:hypothetical protein B0H11DRAFT_2248427 [Mycena galericulata]|nr:hypothetical protein B0H11DRAFT_2248427 [Mycena galericulata]